MRNQYNLFLALLGCICCCLLFTTCKRDSYDCINGNCEAVRGGDYLTLADCMLMCNGSGGNNDGGSGDGSGTGSGDGSGTGSGDGSGSGSGDGSGSGSGSGSGDGSGDGSGSGSGSGDGDEVSFNCVGQTCFDPGNGNGVYATYAACIAACNNSEQCDNAFINEDDNEEYSIGGLTEAINFGNFYNNTTTNFEVRCFSSSVSGGIPNYSGFGNLIYLNLHTNGSLTGAYSFNSNGFNPSVNTWDGGVLTEENMYNYGLGMIFPSAASSGSIVISEGQNGMLDIEFSMVTTDGNYSGCYVGVPVYYDTDGSGSSGSGSGGITDEIDYQGLRKHSNSQVW